MIPTETIFVSNAILGKRLAFKVDSESSARSSLWIAILILLLAILVLKLDAIGLGYQLASGATMMCSAFIIVSHGGDRQLSLVQDHPNSNTPSFIGNLALAFSLLLCIMIFLILLQILQLLQL